MHVLRAATVRPAAAALRRGRPLFTSGASPIYSAWSIMGSPLAVEFVASAGYDVVVVDCQHGVFDETTMVASLAAIAASPNRPRSIVRVAENNAAAIGKALDAGADGLICPMVSSAAECESFVRAASFPPLGERSYGMHRASLARSGMSPGDMTRDANAKRCLLAMLETRGALDELDSILRVPGLDGIFIGPNDLGLALGYEPTADPQGAFLAEIEGALAQTHAHGKKAGIFCGTAEVATAMARRGFDLVNVGIDLSWCSGAAASQLAAVRAEC